MNRDFVTASQPEVRAMRQIEIDKQPAVMLDLHGYVNGTLIEPTTPPHGENYEYDLFLKNTYANALGMESAVNGLGYTPAKDGVRARADPVPGPGGGLGRLAADLHPAVRGLPRHGRRAHRGDPARREQRRLRRACPCAELRRRSAINTDVAGAAIRATLDFVRENRASLVADQIEVFRRGAAGAAQVPVSGETVPGVPGIGPEDVYTTTSRAPTSSRGRAAPPAAARLVDHLLANDVRVTRATRDFRLGGTDVRRGLVRRRHAPAQARPGERAARRRPGHQRQGLGDVRHLGLESGPAVGRHGRAGDVRRA